jgi:hypothetical protein
MSKIGDYLLKWRTHFQKPSVEIQRQAMNYADAREIGVLFNMREDANHQVLNDFVATLRKDNKQVTALAYFERESSNPYNFAFEFFRKKDISARALGKIKSAAVDKFKEKSFDFLFCINTENFPPFDNILLHSQAKCRIGIFHEGQEAEFELMIALQEGEGEDVLIRQMLHYTKNLTRN